MSSQDNKTEHLWNLIYPPTAARAARKLRRNGYQVTVNQQWLTVTNEWADYGPSMILREYHAIAY
jgi:hypothetical protein